MKRKIDNNVTLLGLVSLFTSTSSEMVYPLLPLFVTSALGVGTAFLGLLEGIAESTAGIVKVLAGWYADKLRHRKPLMIGGYSLSTVSKPFLYFASAGWHVLLVRFVDRMGQGVRVPPRDALVADSALPTDRGMSFGFQQAMERFGVVVGPMAATAILVLSGNKVRLVFLLAVLPAAIAVFIVVVFVRERYVMAELPHPAHVPDEAPFAADYKWLIVVFAVFTLGNPSDMFIVLRARSLGVGVSWLPILWLMYNLICSLTAAPLGELSDRIGRKRTPAPGLCCVQCSLLRFRFCVARDRHLDQHGRLRRLLWPQRGRPAGMGCRYGSG